MAVWRFVDHDVRDTAPDILWPEVRSSMGRLTFNPNVGNLRQLKFRDGGRWLCPLATAPWVEREDAPPPGGLAPVERDLSGDFFCAPFGASDVETAPPHGWSANSHWTVERAEEREVQAKLDRSIMGARIHKTLRLCEDAPLLFQEHWVMGGNGALTVAHHPMVRLKGGGRFSCSAKRAALTADTPLEPGRNRLALAASSPDLTRFPDTSGGTIDLTYLPIADAHEDFVTLVEAEANGIGWSAVVREAEGDIVFFLKDSRVLPVTMLWHSNGGRDYPPWHGVHRGVLGVEDGCAAGPWGHRAALARNRVADSGVSTFLRLATDTSERVAHVVGAISNPDHWSIVNDISLSADQLILTGDAGDPRRLPFPSDFFQQGA